MESKRLKRLEKNRESARECRRRKKENKEKLEAQLATLEASLTVRVRVSPPSPRTLSRRFPSRPLDRFVCAAYSTGPEIYWAEAQFLI